jgi:hypothetical protein
VATATAVAIAVVLGAVIVVEVVLVARVRLVVLVAAVAARQYDGGGFGAATGCWQVVLLQEPGTGGLGEVLEPKRRHLPSTDH